MHEKVDHLFAQKTQSQADIRQNSSTVKSFRSESLQCNFLYPDI